MDLSCGAGLSLVQVHQTLVTCLGAHLGARPRIRLKLGWTDTSCMCKVVPNVQNCAKIVQNCAKCAKLCKNCAKLCQMCKKTEDQTETWLDGDILHPTTRPPESGATTANSSGFRCRDIPHHSRQDRVNQQVGAVSEATTADCALKLDESILSPVRSTQHLGWQTDRAEIG